MDAERTDEGDLPNGIGGVPTEPRLLRNHESDPSGFAGHHENPSRILHRFRCLWYTKKVIYLGLGSGSCYFPSYPRYYPSYPSYYPRCYLSFIEP